jgi:uroporphyrinogen decarboxylase
MLLDGAGGPHIANLGHGIFKETPPDHARAFVRAVQDASARLIAEGRLPQPG